MTHHRVLLLTLTAAFSVAAPVRAETWRVTADGTGDAPTLQAAADSAASGDTLLVAPGAYAEHLLVSGKALLIRGESGAEETVLDGQLSGRILTVMGRHALTLEGLAFVRGRAGGGETNSTGGAIAAYGTPVSIRNCIFRSNVSTNAGGAVFSSFFGVPEAPGADPLPSHLHVANTLFENNRAGGDGGGIYSDDVGTTLVGVAFRGNDGVAGGAVALGDGVHTVVDCSFEENDAVHGGGVHVSGEGTVSLEGSLFSNNRAEDFGGGLRAVSGFQVSFSRCWFLNNRAFRGGGVHSLLTPVTADRVLWYGGTATDRGGGLFLDHTDNTTFTRCTWLENSAPRGASLTSAGAGLTIQSCLGGDESITAFDCGSGSTVSAGCNAGGAVTAGCFLFQARATVAACPAHPEALCTLPTVAGCGTVGHADSVCPAPDCNTPVLPVTWGRLKTLYGE
jgi:predicted outer membrane repeat protein